MRTASAPSGVRFDVSEAALAVKNEEMTAFAKRCICKRFASDRRAVRAAFCAARDRGADRYGRGTVA
jgi:hypothetical protein